jgi:choline transporter-like protein 2/4/5
MIVMYGANSKQEGSEGFLAIAVVFAIVFVILLLVVFCFRRKIQMSIQFIKEASKASSANVLVMFFPVVQSILEVLVFVFAVYVYLQLSTVGTPMYNIQGSSCYCDGQQLSINSTCEPISFKQNCQKICAQARCDLHGIETNLLIKLFIGYTWFEYLWVMFFLTAFSEMVLAGVFAVWYWTMHKEDVPPGAFWDSVGRTMK